MFYTFMDRIVLVKATKLLKNQTWVKELSSKKTRQIMSQKSNLQFTKLQKSVIMFVCRLDDSEYFNNFMFCNLQMGPIS
jgi:hypothetical protein